MIAHRQIMKNAAAAITASEEIRAFCVEHFGKGLLAVVGAYAGREDAAGIPDVQEAPFCWIYAEGENEEVIDDQNFLMHVVVGAVVVGRSGEKVISVEVTPRTASENGMVVNGGDDVVEALRELVATCLYKSKLGAAVARYRRIENDISHFPLLWAELEVELMTPGHIGR